MKRMDVPPLVGFELIPEVVESAEISLYFSVERGPVKSTRTFSGGKHSYSNGLFEQQM